VCLALEYELINDAYSYYLRFTVLVDLGLGIGIDKHKMTLLPSIVNTLFNGAIKDG
jgi:hypothetical protein